MKSLVMTLVVCVIFASCSLKENAAGSTSSDSTSHADSLQNETEQHIASIVEPKNPWIIPTTASWNDPEHFVLVIPDRNNEFPLWKDPEYTKYDQSISDTAQGKFSTTSPGGFKCDGTVFYQVSLDKGARTQGWATNDKLMFLGQKDLGDFVIGDRRLKLASMKPRQDSDGAMCYSLHTLFFYNDQYLYLIDATNADENLRWNGDNHLTVVNLVPGAAFTGKQDGNDFVITWGEPNVTVELRVTWDTDHLKFVSHEVKQLDSDVGGREGEEAETHIEICTLNSAGLGDCFHLEFSCGDFGNAIVSKLDKNALALWDELTVSDQDDQTSANPKYAGKTFEIVYQYTTGDVCGDPADPTTSDEVPLILSFRLKE